MKSNVQKCLSSVPMCSKNVCMCFMVSKFDHQMERKKGENRNGDINSNCKKERNLHLNWKNTGEETELDKFVAKWMQIKTRGAKSSWKLWAIWANYSNKLRDANWTQQQQFFSSLFFFMPTRSSGLNLNFLLFFS